MKYVLFLILSVTGFAVWAETKPLERYLDGIVKPCPFGQVPDDFDPAADPTSRAAIGGVGAVDAEEVPLSEQQQALQQVVNATVIHIDPTTRVPWLGFTDATNAKSPRTHFVAEGASEDGWTVKEIDLVKKSAKLAKGEVEIDVVVGAPPPPKASGRGAAQGGAAQPGAVASRSGGLSGMRSLREARREQEIVQRKQFESSQQAADEARRRQEELEARQEQEKAEREAEREAQREELKNLAERLEQRMKEAREQKAEKAEETESDE